MMRKILLSLGLLVIFVSSTFALLPEERVLMYRVFDKLDTQLSKKSISKQVESLSGMITTIHAWERVEGDYFDNRTKNVVYELMKFLCVKRQSLNGFVCPKDVFKPNRIYSANAIGVIDTKNHLIKLQNDMRKDYLRDGLFYDKYLAATAQGYADILCSYEHFDHIGPNGSTMQERVELSGYDYTLIGENLAYGYDNADLTLLQLWLSDGHRENILKRGFKDVGVGYCDNYWVILYGSKH